MAHVDHGDYECDGDVCRPKRKFGAAAAAAATAETTEAQATQPPVSQSALENLLGTELVSKTGRTSVGAALVGKYVFVYFSAGWCGPCRAFTPRLKEFYERHRAAKNFEVVWVSSDNDQRGYDEYYSVMPWLALPFSDRGRKAALSRRFRVQGVPTLVLLAPDGSGITTEARARVMEDPSAEAFPWKPLTPLQTLGKTFLSKEATTGGTVDADTALKGKYVAVYFSASWCGPCRAFLPVLKSVYAKLRAEGKPFEFVWVSFDRDQASFDGYYKEMPWLAVPFSDRKRAMALASLWNVEGIPTLVMVSPDDKTLNTGARQAIMQDPEGRDFPWAPKPVQSIAEAAEYINEEPCVIACVAALGDDAKRKAFAELEAAAKLLAPTDAGVKFVVADERNSIVAQIRALTKLGDISKPHMILIDIADGGAWFDLGADISADAVVKNVALWKAQQLERHQLGH